MRRANEYDLVGSFDLLDVGLGYGVIDVGFVCHALTLLYSCVWRVTISSGSSPKRRQSCIEYVDPSAKH